MDENFEATSQIQNAEHSQPKPRYFVYKSGWGREEKQYDSFTDVLADMGYREGRSKFDYPVYEPVEEFDDNSFDDDDDINWEEYTSEEPQEDESHTSSETETEQDPNRFMINGRRFENANDGFQALMDWNTGSETSVPFEVVSNTPVELRGSPPDNSGRWTWSKTADRWKYKDDDAILSEIDDEESLVGSLALGIMEKCLQDISYVPSVEEAKIMALELAWGGMDRSPNSSYNQCHKMVGMVEQIVNPAELEQQLPEKHSLLIAFNEVSEACFEFDTSAHEMQQLMHMSQFIQRLDQPAVDELALYMTANLDILKDALSCSTDRNMYVYEMMRLPYSDQVAKEVGTNIAEHLAKALTPRNEEQVDPYAKIEAEYLHDFFDWNTDEFIRIAMNLDHNQTTDRFIGAYLSRRNFSTLLNGVREQMHDPNTYEKAHDLLLYLLGDLKNKQGDKPATVDKNTDEFYTVLFVEPKEGYHLNTHEAQDVRHTMVTDVLAKYGVSSGAKVFEGACGDGWLSDMLEKDGFDVTAADKHPDLLRRTQERNENLHVLQLDWNERDQWDEMIAEHGKNSFDVVVINGRSVRHATPQILFGYVSDILKDGGIFMWDTPDVLKKGSAQADKLENIRTFYERFGYDRKYLEKNFWYMVGAPPGQNDDKNHYIESWTPSEAYAKDTAAMAGLETLETIREVNYDGANSDNLYFVMRKVEGKRRREFISESIRNMNNDMNDEL